MSVDRRGVLGAMGGLAALLGVPKVVEAEAAKAALLPEAALPVMVEPTPEPNAIPSDPHDTELWIAGHRVHLIDMDMADEVRDRFVRRSTLRCRCYGPIPLDPFAGTLYEVEVRRTGQTYRMRAGLAYHQKAFRSDHFVEDLYEFVGDGWTVSA